MGAPKSNYSESLESWNATAHRNSSDPLTDTQDGYGEDGYGEDGQGEDGGDPRLSQLMQGYFETDEIESQRSFTDLVEKQRCHWTEEHFVLFETEEQLLPEIQIQIENHLRTCISCQEAWKHSQRLKKIFILPEIEPRSSLQDFWRKVECATFEEDFLAFHQDELALDQQERLSAHLSLCSSCTQTFKAIKENLLCISSLFEKEIEPSPHSWNTLKTKLEASLLSAPPALPRWKILLSSSLLLVALLLVFGLLWNHPPLYHPPTLRSGELFSQNVPVEKLFYGTTLSTKTYIARVSFEQVSLWIQKNSSFTLHSPHALTLHQGEIFVEVHRKGYPLTLETSNAHALVLGTKFNLQTHPTQDQTLLAVVEGQVAFGEKKSHSFFELPQTVSILPGMQAQIEKGLLSQSQRYSQPQEILSWEQKILSHYYKNALEICLVSTPLHPHKVDILFKNHADQPLKISAIRSNATSYFWQIESAQESIQRPALSTHLLAPSSSPALYLSPEQTYKVSYDLSSYLQTSGNYRISLNYIPKEAKDTSFWNGHAQSNTIHLQYP